jgi:hypothetical protein
MVYEKESGMDSYQKTRMDASLIPKIEAQVLFADFLEAVLRFYENPENTADFERWLNERKGGNVDGEKISSTAPAVIPEPCTIMESV